ncbi:hypothetical protein [Corynebacterium sp. A21]|uniref:hypothetical protein n=1 Tax=Corynebacterium sp. A21 TaxID=3457318 RepID=UPI003FD44B90
MAVIRLASGQSHRVPKDGFIAQLRIFVSGDLNFEVETGPTLESFRRANSDIVALRNPTGDAEITVLPGHGYPQFPTGTSLHATLTIGQGEETRLELPAFEVGGLRASTIAWVVSEGDEIRLQAGETGSAGTLDAGSAGVRSALRSSIDRGGLPEGRRRDVTLLVDVTSSMAHSTSQAAFEAMCTFAAGVLSTASDDRRIRLLTSSDSIPPEQLAGTEGVRELGKREFARREVGWGVDLAQLEPDEALVVISDDLPAEVLKFQGVVHLLSSRAPLAKQGITATVFDEKLIRAVQEQNASVLTGPTRIMYDTLTRGEK